MNGIERGQLNWEEVAIGVTAMQECPCSQAMISRQASRVCSGEFINGGSWMDSNASACEFDPLAWDLCAATVSLQCAIL